MSEPVWFQFLTPRDKEVFAAAGYGARAGYGKRPALLIIDVNYNFCGDRREPIVQSIKRWRNSCGEDAWDALPVLKRVIDAAHTQGLPVIYTTGVRRPDNWDAGSWSWKNNRNDEAPTVMHTNQDGNEIMPQIAPDPSDIVVPKQKPSGFYGTNLLSYLTLARAATASSCAARRRAAACARPCSTASATISAPPSSRTGASTARRRATRSTCATCTQSTPTW